MISNSGTDTPTICLDFDGVIHQFESWDGPIPTNEPVLGALQFVKWLVSENYELIICSCRAGDNAGLMGIISWLEAYKFPAINVTYIKPMADMYIDDRGFRFGGNFEVIRKYLLAFGTRTWHEKK